MQNLWQKGTDWVLDMCVTNTDAASYLKKSLEKCILTAEREKNGSNWILSYSSTITSPLSLYQWTSYWERKLKPCWNVCPVASPPSGGNLTHVSVFTSRVRLPYHWCKKPTYTSEAWGLLRDGSAFRSLSGKTAPGLISTGEKRAVNYIPEKHLRIIFSFFEQTRHRRHVRHPFPLLDSNSTQNTQCMIILHQERAG